MNERYLFRGKRKDNGEWAYGGLDTDWGLKPEQRDRYWIIQAYLGEALVIPETIGQCTGLTDKNGKLIFEGDIVRTKHYGKVIENRNVADYDVFKVVYTYAMYRAENKNRAFNLVDGERYEVIGNIHDNPELLEVSK